MKYQKRIKACGAAVILIVAAIFLAMPCHAAKISDLSKQRQAKSMEYIGWNFSPSMYYGTMHHSYSGAKSKFLFFDYSFHEERSNVKRLCWIRNENLGLEVIHKQLMQAERDSLLPVVKEELYRSVDRNVDIHYNDYKKDYDYYLRVIDECLDYALKRSRGKYCDMVAECFKSKEGLEDKVKYIHRTGIGNEMESASRKESYEQALEEMKRLYQCSLILAQSAVLMYPPVNN